MKLQHTQGPWEIQDKCGYGHDIRTPYDHGNGWIWIVFVNGSHDGSKGFPTDEECEANARLIAAAPEMLEALIDIYGLYLEHDICCDNRYIKNIIEKATGMSIEEVLSQ